MRAWLERIEPQGSSIELPQGSGLLVFGRAAGCTVIFDDPLVSPRHGQLSWAQGFWRLKDLGSQQGTVLNEQPLEGERALFSSDEIRLGNTRLRFVTDLPQDDAGHLEALARGGPDSEGLWAAWADQLQERGDPLGERIANSMAGARLEHLPWLGGLADAFLTGALELQWHRGFIQRATLRSVAGRVPLDWRALVTSLLNLRVGRLLRELVIDLLRLEPETNESLKSRLDRAQQFLVRLPSLPSSLENLSLGYQFNSAVDYAPTTELRDRLPRLNKTPLFAGAPLAGLRLMSRRADTKLIGIDEVRLLHDVTRLRRDGARVYLESPPGIPFITAGNPCYFSMTGERLQLTVGRPRGEIKVNGRVDTHFELLPGDEIDILGGATLRVELFETARAEPR